MNKYNIETCNLKTKDQILVETYLELFLNISSRIKEEVSMAGNILLNQLFPSDARSTNDLDVCVTTKKIYEEVIKDILKDFGESILTIEPGGRYQIREVGDGNKGGLVVYAGSGERIYSVDIALETSVLIGVVEYEFSGVRAYGSSIERIICDKSLATLSKAKFRRVKDFYDIYIILKSKIKLEYSEICDLMIKRVGYEEVGRLLNGLPFLQKDTEDLIYAWNKLSLTRIDGEPLERPEFEEMILMTYNMYRNIKVEYGKRGLIF